MPSPTYTPLANITLGSAAANVVFSSISGSYRDLRLIISGKTTADMYGVLSEINGDTGSNMSRVRMTGNGSTAVSSADSNTYSVLSDESATSVGITTLDFMDYSATDKHKTILMRGNTAAISTTATAIRWASTSPITGFKISAASSTWQAGTTFSLYGIAS